MTDSIKWNRQPGDSPPAKEGKTIPYPCVVCEENVQESGVECDWCGQWEHSKCANLTEDELKVLVNINSCVKFFYKIWVVSSCKSHELYEVYINKYLLITKYIRARYSQLEVPGF